jgi:predicted ATP-dependent endonuclease of OLD family
MRVTKLYVRFFRSFNYDYERKAILGAERHPWEFIDGVWYPFVRVPLDPSVTAVVGANESGKTHLVTAIDLALTGSGIDRGDFCRYSTLYEVEKGARRNPDFGVELRIESDEDLKVVPKLTPEAAIGDFVTLLRLGDGHNLLLGPEGEEKKLSDSALAKLATRLPNPFTLKTNIPLPDSISLSALLGRDLGSLDNRKRRFRIFEYLRGMGEPNNEEVSASSAEIAEMLATGDSEDSPAKKRRMESAQLAKSLLLEVANIDPSAFGDLEAELREGSEGKVGGLVEKMNRALARHLNISRWWTQDPEFRLQLEARERDLVFIIRDRTETKYSFAERSRGLTYFLSYFVQLQAHRLRQDGRKADGPSEILLMDEPDAYLSSIGQQDLLKALEEFAKPAAGGSSDQVAYVTHSPFLLNRNAAHRIRVLDKGTDQEGTRVVKDASQNHYEPLRTSIGAYVAETAFIGGTNLLVEGVADQVLLSSLTSQLRHRGVGKSQRIDLNETTIVPAGGAPHVPYMAYLARGRDVAKPACVALLDGDEEGLDSATRLRDGDGVRERPIIEDAYVLDVASWAAQHSSELQTPSNLQIIELEDLIPPAVAAEAARSYAIAMLRSDEGEVEALTEQKVIDQLTSLEEGGVWDAVKAAFREAFNGGKIEKVGFAKEVAAFVDANRDVNPPPSSLKDLERNFGALISTLAERLSAAEAEELSRRTNRRSDRIVKSFLADFSEPSTRDQALATLREVELSLENTRGDDAVRAALGGMRRDFDLEKDPLDPVPEFDDFRERVYGLASVRREAYRRNPDASPAERAAASD